MERDSVTVATCAVLVLHESVSWRWYDACERGVGLDAVCVEKVTLLCWMMLRCGLSVALNYDASDSSFAVSCCWLSVCLSTHLPSRSLLVVIRLSHLALVCVAACVSSVVRTTSSRFPCTSHSSSHSLPIPPPLWCETIAPATEVLSALLSSRHPGSADPLQPNPTLTSSHPHRRGFLILSPSLHHVQLSSSSHSVPSSSHAPG